MDLLQTDTESCLITSRIPGEPFGELLAHLTAEGNEIERKEAIASIRDIIPSSDRSRIHMLPFTFDTCVMPLEKPSSTPVFGVV
jgi:hypothetical protein